MSTLLFFLRSKRTFILLWTIPLALLLASVPQAIKSSYPDQTQLNAVIEQMRASLGTTVFYGIPTTDMGYSGWAVWETVPWMLILGSVMAIMLAASIGRAAEENGQLEVLSSTGVSAKQIRLLTIGTVFIAAAFFGLLCILVLLAQMLVVEGFTVTGSVLSGLLIASVVSCLGLITLLGGEVFGTARQARSTGLAFLAVFFILRALADVYTISWLRWLTPLGWRDLIAPYTKDEAWPLLVILMILILLAIPTAVRHRDLNDQFLYISDHKPRARGFGSLGLLWHLQQSPILWWVGSIVLLAVGFFGMTGEMTSVFEQASATIRTMISFTGMEDFGEVYAQYVGQFLGILVGCAAVRTVLSLASFEHHGYLDVHLSTGAHRLKVLATMLFFAVIALLVTVLAAGILGGKVALNSGIDSSIEEHVRWAMIDLIPGVITLLGLAVFFLGLHSKTAQLAWFPVIFSGFITFFGELLQLPDWLNNLSVFAWSAHTVDHYTGAAVLVALGVATAILGGVLYHRRDLA